MGRILDAKDQSVVVDTIKLGFYPQGQNGEKAPIEWLMLKKDGERALLVSRFALDCLPYNSVSSGITWETCSLRKWLNGAFFSNAFSDKEQKKINSSAIAADRNPYYSTSPGNRTIDKVFLLSATDAIKFFKSDDERKCVPTDYARVRGAYSGINYSLNGKATCCWWLRSPGRDSGLAEYVFSDGSVSDNGDDIDESSNCIRPAIWVSIDNSADLANESKANGDGGSSEHHLQNGKPHESVCELPNNKIVAGSYVKFGSYPQSREGKNAPIGWRVLENDSHRALLISRQALSCQPFNTFNTGVTWETCSLRKWLNETFLQAAFTAEEQKRIIITNVAADSNPIYSTSPGNNTVDKVFLLSINEANRYFRSNQERECNPTEYVAELNKSEVKGYHSHCWWWLRTPGHYSHSAADVSDMGCVSNGGRSVFWGTHCVRPALWIKLDS